MSSANIGANSVPNFLKRPYMSRFHKFSVFFELIETEIVKRKSQVSVVDGRHWSFKDDDGCDKFINCKSLRS